MAVTPLMRLRFGNRELLNAIHLALLVVIGWATIQISGCADDPLFAPEPPKYTWNPGTLHADSVSYRDDDSITLYGHFKPKAFVITVNAFWISVIEKQGTTKKEQIYYLQKNGVWNFKPENYADTSVVAMLKVSRLVPKPGTVYYFSVHLNIVPPPGYPTSAGVLESNSVEVRAGRKG